MHAVENSTGCEQVTNMIKAKEALTIGSTPTPDKRGLFSAKAFPARVSHRIRCKRNET